MLLKLTAADRKVAELANSVDFDKVAHHEPPYLLLHCLLSTL